ncbi:Gem-associated protein 5, partial [Podila epigama]
VGVKAVEWTSDGKFVVSGDKHGKVVVWDPVEGITSEKDLSRRYNISCIKACPTRPDIVAIGMDSGDIIICQVTPAPVTILRRLHGHTGKIHGLSWQPSATNEDGHYTLLASGSSDQTLRVWDVDKEIAVQNCRVPDCDQNIPPHLKAKVWVPVEWTSGGDSILGTMIRWKRDQEPGQFVRLVDGKTHDRTVFQIMTWPGSDFAFSISLDRRIIAWDVHDGAGMAQVDCLGGNVLSLDIGTVDPGRIAMGCANDMIKVWDTLNQEEPYACLNLDRLQSKVHAVKWHPVDEGVLAFGLENGRIGFFDNLSRNTAVVATHRKKGKHPNSRGKKGKPQQTQVFFQSYHEKDVAAIEWCSPRAFEAPVPELFDLSLKASTFCVVSCGRDGKILVSDASRPTLKGLDLEIVIQKQNQIWYQSQKAFRKVEGQHRRTFAFHPNEDLLAIGNSDGSVEVFELKYFRLVYVYHGHQKRIEKLKWNWSNDSSTAPWTSYLLASGADDGRIAIHKLDQFSRSSMTATNQYQKQTVDLLPTAQCFATFRGQSRGVSDMAWSPHCQDSPTQCLVTTSYDGSTFVLEVALGDVPQGGVAHAQDDGKEKGLITSESEHGDTPKTTVKVGKIKAVARFPRHEQAFAVHWSLTDVDRIYSGGNDWTLWNWDWKSHMKRVTGDGTIREHGQHEENDRNRPTDNALPKDSAPAVAVKNVRVEEQEAIMATEGSVDELLAQIATAKEKLLAEAADAGPLEEGSVEAPAVVVSSSLKRDATHDGSSHPSHSKRAKIESVQTSDLSTTRRQLFPKSTTKFESVSKQTAHLEVIRLARNIFCRRLRHGVLVDEVEMEATRRRWRAMREFFEKDGEPEGVALSKVLGEDFDELNLASDTEGDAPQEMETSSSSAEQSTVFNGDLIFYGSRTAVIAFAEMEAREQAAGNFFVPGTGFGVLKARIKTQQQGPLAQIPVAYWLGDVPKMCDLLKSMPATELGIQDWIGIALSPMGGVAAWKEMMATTAAKFLQRREVHAAVLCLLGIGRVYEAVDAYRSQGLYREALTLLRIRSTEYDGDEEEDDDEEEEEQEENRDEDKDDLDAKSSAQGPEMRHATNEDKEAIVGQDLKDESMSPKDLSRLHIAILSEWGQQLDRNGRYEQACKCQLTLASLLQRQDRRKSKLKSIRGEDQSQPISLTPTTIALNTFARRTDIASLRTAAGLAILLQDPSQQARIDAYELAFAKRAVSKKDLICVAKE